MYLHNRALIIKMSSTVWITCINSQQCLPLCLQCTLYDYGGVYFCAYSTYEGCV